jgi:Ger(x)C family germination protein
MEKGESMLNWQRVLALLFVAFTLCSLTGCWDRRELEERISVVAIAVDNAEQTTSKAKYAISIQIPIPTRIAGGGEGGGGEGGASSVQVMTSTGLSLHHALDNLQKRLNQELFFGHVRILVVSEEVAREGVREIIDFFRRDPQVRRQMGFVITHDHAKDALKVFTNLEQVPAVYLMSIIESGGRRDFLPEISLGDFTVCLSTPFLDPMTYYSKIGDSDFSWNGLALFHKDKLVGTITERETWLLMHLTNQGSGGNILIQLKDHEKNKNNTLIINPGTVKTKTKLNVSDGHVKARYDVALEVDIRENNTTYQLSNLKQLQEVSDLIAEQLEREAKQLVHKLQKEYGVDALQLGLKLKAYHHKEWKKMVWEEIFPNAHIDIHYDVKIRRTGLQTVN